MELQRQYLRVSLKIRVCREHAHTGPARGSTDQHVDNGNRDPLRQAGVASLSGNFVISRIYGDIGKRGESPAQFFQLSVGLNAGKHFLPDQPYDPCTSLPYQIRQLSHKPAFPCIQVLWFSAERERPYRRVDQNIHGGHSLPLAPRLLVIVVLVVVDFAEQIQNGQLLPPPNIFVRGGIHRILFCPVMPQLPRFVYQAVIESQIRGHFYT
jgi:hypothetical protein